ncbi:Abi family protein [Paucilactobacillus suebicus]|uniref:Abi family protein n=1 Tax=Paucilactobacillus suebicus TaxID=152335 RepID=UPI0002490591|nr:Abi family protein [Paucilactobacillus suebicus]
METNSSQPEFDKPFSDYEHQLTKLKRRGIYFPDSEKTNVLSLIKQHGYYQLINGYADAFEISNQSHEKSYANGTEFNDVFAQFYFDRTLGNLLFRYLLNVEENFTNLLSYEVAKKFGVNNYYGSDLLNQFPSVMSYLDMRRYTNSNTSSLTKLHNLSLNCQKDPTKWYRENCNHIPPWILLMNAELGITINYFKILPFDIKKEIISNLIPPVLQYEQYEEYECSRRSRRSGRDYSELDIQSGYSHLFVNGLNLMREFRNCIAHNNRLYKFRSKFTVSSLIRNIPRSTTIYSTEEYYNGIGKNDLFSLLIWIIICQPNKAINLLFIDSLHSTLESFKEADPSNSFFVGSELPGDYYNRLKEYINDIR